MQFVRYVKSTPNHPCGAIKVHSVHADQSKALSSEHTDGQCFWWRVDHAPIAVDQHRTGCEPVVRLLKCRVEVWFPDHLPLMVVRFFVTVHAAFHRILKDRSWMCFDHRSAYRADDRFRRDLNTKTGTCDFSYRKNRRHIEDINFCQRPRRATIASYVCHATNACQLTVGKWCLNIPFDWPTKR